MQKNKPKLRFPEFSDAWEQKRLGEIALTFSGGTPSVHNKSYYGEYIPFIRSSEINKSKTELFLSEKGLKNSSAKLVKKGDILFALYGATSGEIGLSKINGAINQAILAIITNSNYNKQFIVNWFKLEKENILNKYLQGGQGNLSAAIIKALQISFPTLPEQQKIGDFFSLLDQLINIHQRKLENAKKLKKSLLQKMFPKNGKTIPEIRFPEFSENWEQRRLGEIANKVTEKNKNGLYQETFTNSAEFGIISQRDFFDKDISNAVNTKNYFIISSNDFVYNPRISNLAPVGPIKRNKLKRKGIMSPLYFIFRFSIDVNYYFLDAYFETSNWHLYIKSNGDNGVRADRIAIKDSLLMQMPIPLPSLPEQQKIGEFFSHLDQLINLHQRKLENIKNLKKSLLQKMFV